MHGTIQLRHASKAPPPIRCCVGCPAALVGTKALRCEPCRRAHNAIVNRSCNKRWRDSAKGRADKRRRQREYLARNRAKQNAHNRNYYARLRAEGKLSTGKSGKCRYLQKHIAHVRAFNLFMRSPEGRRKARLRAKPPAICTAYPFVTTADARHASLLQVNAIVPRGIAGREDICQSIMLAILEGETTLTALLASRAELSKFCRAHHRANFEQSGHAISLDVPRHDGRSWFDVLPAAEASA